MSYGHIDAIIEKWAKEHGLHLQTHYRDEEVRSIELVDSQARRYQIWIDPPKEGEVEVHAWDFNKRRWDQCADPFKLNAALEEAFARVEEWMSA